MTKPDTSFVVIKPCPFCGSKKSPAYQESNYPGEGRIVCDATNYGCGGSAGYTDGKAKAIQKWNGRPYE